jgi:succinate dehydrogenase/fumarate reductase-like Fe-S protein
MKLEISLFRFDCKSDYLPYYTKHFLNVEENNTLLTVLNKLNSEDEFSFENSPNSYFVVNDIYMSVMTTCKQIKEKFGSDIKIEPLSIRRVNKDFIINEDDFHSKLSILSEFISLDLIKNNIDKEFKELYESYKIYFYASNTLNVEYNYIGDAILLLACDLIEKFPNKEKEILNRIKESEYGIQFHTSLSNRILNFDQSIEDKIVNLKNKLNISKTVDKQNFKSSVSKKIDFGTFKKVQNIKHDFKDFSLAYLKSENSEDKSNLISNLKAKVLNLSSLNQDLAKDTFHLNPELTYKLTSTLMLDAYDSGADFIVVDNDQDFYLLDFNRKNMESVIGREINIPVLHINELENLAMGEYDLAKATFKNHTLDPKII